MLDAETCRDAVRGMDAVYHLAGAVSRDTADSGLMYDVHIKGTRQILQACHELKVKRVLVASSSGTIGVGTDNDFLADEHSPVPWDLIGEWPYYESKALAEREVQYFVAQGLPVKMVRPTLLLGPGDFNGSSTQDVCSFLSGDVKAALPGGMSFVDVRDVANILPTIMEQGEPGCGYLLGAANIPVRDFLIALEQVSGVKAPSFTLPRGVLRRTGGLFKRMASLPFLGGLDPVTFEMGCHYWYIDSSRAREEFGLNRDHGSTPSQIQSGILEALANVRSKSGSDRDPLVPDALSLLETQSKARVDILVRMRRVYEVLSAGW